MLRSEIRMYRYVAMVMNGRPALQGTRMLGLERDSNSSSSISRYHVYLSSSAEIVSTQRNEHLWTTITNEISVVTYNYLLYSSELSQ